MGLSLFIAAHDGDEIAGMVKGFGNVGCEIGFANQDSEVLSNLKKMKSLSAIMLSSNVDINVCKQVLSARKKVLIYIMAENGCDKGAFKENGFNNFMERPYHTPEILHEITKALSDSGSGTAGKSLADNKMAKIFLIGAIILFIIFLIIQVFIPMFITGME